MTTKNTLPISEARKKIFKIAEEAQKPGNYYTFTENGRPKVVLLSAEEFESWQETLEVMREIPDLEERIKKAEKEFERGDYITLGELLAKQGYILADKGKNKYGGEKNEISTNRSKKSSKRIR
jgi:prevent-host-death family protein